MILLILLKNCDLLPIYLDNWTRFSLSSVHPFENGVFFFSLTFLLLIRLSFPFAAMLILLLILLFVPYSKNMPWQVFEGIKLEDIIEILLWNKFGFVLEVLSELGRWIYENFLSDYVGERDCLREVLWII